MTEPTKLSTVFDRAAKAAKGVHSRVIAYAFCDGVSRGTGFRVSPAPRDQRMLERQLAEKQGYAELRIYENGHEASMRWR